MIFHTTNLINLTHLSKGYWGSTPLPVTMTNTLTAFGIAFVVIFLMQTIRETQIANQELKEFLLKHPDCTVLETVDHNIHYSYIIRYDFNKLYYADRVTISPRTINNLQLVQNL